jgi:Xaa-Pro aminopeptidase
LSCSELQSQRLAPWVFKDRRERFLKALDGAIAILPSAPVAIRSNDVEFIYRQDSDFYYLTGFPEPESLAVFAPGHPEGEFVLFVRPRDKEREIWTGPRIGAEGAMADFGADRACLSEEIERVLPQYLEGAAQVHYPLGVNERLDSTVLRLLRTAQSTRERLGRGPRALLDPRAITHEMRLFKSEQEIAVMRQAAQIAAAAHCEAMRRVRQGMMEWEIEALVNYIFRSRGASGASYPPIVASGPNATILHYVTNDRRIGTGELLLLDAGCEYNFYASDITRTFPPAGRFSPSQRELYEVVLRAQLAAIDCVRPGVTIEQVHEAAVNALVEGMRALGLLSGSTEEIIAAGTYRRFYMHRTSHWLGMDVHDVGDYRRDGKSRQLEAGMVLTVEPGLYISADEENLLSREMGAVGIRIEDDVLVTPHGHEVLTADAPKTVDEIEALMAS